jgi:hypothetical protein
LRVALRSSRLLGLQLLWRRMTKHYIAPVGGDGV